MGDSSPPRHICNDFYQHQAALGVWILSLILESKPLFSVRHSQCRMWCIRAVPYHRPQPHVAATHLKLLLVWCIFTFNFILIHLNLSDCVWLKATTLDTWALNAGVYPSIFPKDWRPPGRHPCWCKQQGTVWGGAPRTLWMSRWRNDFSPGEGGLDSSGWGDWSYGNPHHVVSSAHRSH